MNREEIIETLKRYKEKQGKLELKKLEKRKKEIKLKHKEEEEIKTSITQSYTQGSKTNQVSSKVENSVVKKSEKIEELKKEIKDLEKEIELLEIEVEEVNIRLGSLTYLEKEIITAYYIDEISYKDIGNITYYKIKHQTRSEDTIKRMIAKIIEKLSDL